MKLSRERLTLLLCAVMFISGASALVFQTLWFHQAGLAFGVSVWASSLVLTGFMGGLALGSAAAVWFGDRLGPPVRTYSVLEGVVAVSGVGLVFLLPAVGVAFAPLLGGLASEPWALNTTRLGLSLVLLLIPSTAMGLTLPLLVRALVAADPNFGRVLGRLYGWNTMGAVAGALGSEVLLVESFGIRGAAMAAAGMNLVAVALAVMIAREIVREGLEPAVSQARGFPWRRSMQWLTAAFLAGFALLALEVVWFRFLLLFVEGSSLAFAVMLAVVLAGIALGGLASSVWLRLRSEAHRYAVYVAFGASVLCVATYGAFPYVVGPLGPGAIRGFLPVLAVSAPLIFPVSFLSGVFFTLVGASLHRESPSATATTGVLTFANTLGAAVGAAAGGFVFLPYLGMAASFLLIALLYLGIGVLVSVRSPLPRRVLFPAGAVALLVVLTFPYETQLRQHLLSAAGRYSGTRDWRVVALREGLTETNLYVEEFVLGQPSHFRLVTNSLSMSSTEFHGRRYMKLYVYLPVALHPEPKRALLISYGVGSTAKALTDTRSFEEIDVVDISKDVLEMSAVVFPDPQENPLNDPRVRVHVEDGRYFLQTTSRKYDLITGEPPPPHIAGVVNLYTREYFRLIYERLEEGGFVTYWLPLHALSDGSAKAIIRAFLEVFPDATLWHGWREDVMLTGTRGARTPAPMEHFRAQWEDPRVAEELIAVGIEEPEQIGALFIGDAAFLRELASDEPPLVDAFPRRILRDGSDGPTRRNLFRTLEDTDQARRRFEASRWIAGLWPREMIERTLPYFEVQRIVNDLIDIRGHPLEKSLPDLYMVLMSTDLRSPVLWHMGSNSTVQRMIPGLEPGLVRRPEWQYHVAAGLLAERRFEEALAALERAEADPAHMAAARMYRIFLLSLLGRQVEARTLAGRTPAATGEDPGALWWNFLDERFDLRPRHGG